MTLLVMDIYSTDSPISHFNKATYACWTLRSLGRIQGRPLKGYWMVQLACWQKRGKVPVRFWLTWQIHKTLALTTSDSDSLLTYAGVVELNWLTKIYNKSLFSTEIHKNLTKQISLPTSDKQAVKKIKYNKNNSNNKNP